MRSQQAVQRPMGVALIAAIAIVSGLRRILMAVQTFGLANPETTADATKRTLVMVYVVALLALAVVEIVFGLAAWTFKPWAWPVGLVLQGAALAAILTNMVLLNETLTGQAVAIGIVILMLYYLFTPTVRQAFGRA